MITAIIIIGIAFYFFLRETDWLCVRLPVGELKPPKYARYKVYNILKSRKPSYGDTTLYEGNNYPEGYSPNGEPEYQVILSPGIDNVLCGFDWLNKHCASMVDYKPQVFMTLGNVRYSMTIKQPAIIKDIMKANHFTKKQLKALA